MPQRLLSSSLALALACAMLAACGSSEPKTQRAGAGSSGAAKADPASSEAAVKRAAIDPEDPALGEVLATVAGSGPVTRGELLRWMEVGGATRKEGREASSVTACVEKMRNPQLKTPSGLSGSCREPFQKYMEPALSSLIHNQWLLGEAARRGVEVSERELRIELEKSLGPPGSAMARRNLAQTGQTLPEVELNLKLGQISDRLYEGIEARIPKTTQARLESYYQQHKRDYAVPLERDLHIIRFASNASARKALGELRSGRSFASVAKKISVPQPIGTKNGLRLGLSPKEFSEPTLAKAIFRARPGTLVGPVRIFLGYYDFEVTRIHRPRQRTLAQVRPKLLKELPELLHNRTLTTAVAAFKRRWVARTSCHPGWVVQNCKEYRRTKDSESYDAYTL